MIIKEYLGNNVFAEYNGYEIQLYLDNGHESHNLIVLEPQVIKTLLNFIKVQNIKID